MEQVKKKRGRPRKVFPNEIQEIIDDVKKKESNELETNIDTKQIVLEEKKKRNKGWDYTIDDEIKFFDVDQSYELTGYRPINDTMGLNFDPDWFTEARDTFKRNGHYCQFPRNSKAYADFWTQEYIRCRDGLEINGYTITGDHYFFLNYYQLMDLTSAKKAGEGRLFDFPTFFVVQYEWFHYLELCKRLRLNAALMKARGVGFSEMDASLSCNTYNCRRNSVTVIAASLENYLSKTLDKVWKGLSFLNDHTDGGFFKLRQVSDTQLLKKASYYKIINGQKVESGWLSQIQGIVADKPNKIRGDRTDMLIYEEGGSWPNSRKAFIQGDALTGIQGSRFGIKVIGGTGGDSGPALEGLRDMYYNPEVYDILPCRHTHTQSGEAVLTAFFIPAYSLVNLEGYIDKRGYTSQKLGKEYYTKMRDKKLADPKALITYSAEFCFTAEEAFSLEGDNKFNKVLVAEQLANIRLHKIGPKIQTGRLDYTYRNSNHSEENIIGFKWIPDSLGKVKILEHPIWTNIDKDEDGNTVQYDQMNNLYVAGIDSIDIGAADTSDYTKDPSDFCIVIKKRVFGNSDPQYVAIYKDRPEKIRDAYITAIKLCRYYNCMANIEASRMSMVAWAREKKCLQFFMKRPRMTYPDITRRKSTQYGSPATPTVIDHQTDLIASFVEDYSHTIWFEEMLDELNRYTDDNKRKFDIIAAMGMAELGDEELQGLVPKKVEVATNSFPNIGYYTDEDGYKRYGLIPDKPKFETRFNFDNIGDNSGNRTSDPRYR